MVSGFSASLSGQTKIMLFIDGGYLRKYLKEKFGDDRLDYQRFANDLRAKIPAGSTSVKLIRAYYYDAIPHPPNPKEIRDDNEALLVDEINNQIIPTLKVYFDKIRNTDYFDVRLGDLVILPDKKRRQKGVDALIAIDMITKAYQSQYDEAILVAGDRDFVQVVEAVKHLGPRVHGVYFEGHIATELKHVFDKRHVLTEGELKNCRMNLN